jgi:hypothetical protein
MATGSFAEVSAASREAGDRYVNPWAGIQQLMDSLIDWILPLYL